MNSFVVLLDGYEDFRWMSIEDLHLFFIVKHMQLVFSLLDSSFLVKVQQLIARLTELGHAVVPLSGFRSIEEQAKLWRRGRSTYEIQSRIGNYRLNGYSFLADVLEKVGPQDGVHCTNSLPGTSWHNWGMALDVLVDGKQAGDDPVYQTLSIEALKLGLKTGINFPFKDSGHIQNYSFEVPAKYTMQQINDHFKASEGK